MLSEYKYILDVVFDQWEKEKKRLNLEKSARVCPVGGFVRDILCGVKTDDFDFVVEGEVRELAREVMKRLGGRNFKHFDMFGTASFELPEGSRVDFARAREDFYPIPGKHPLIKFVDNVEKDLGRRDFSINAMAIDMTKAEPRLIDPFGGFDDLKRRQIRVLHKMSISDDPTRILRAVRLSLKLKFDIHEDTITSLEIAKKNGAFRNVSGDRFFSEIKIASKEKNFFMFILKLDELSVLFSIHPALSLSERQREKLIKMSDLEEICSDKGICSDKENIHTDEENKLGSASKVAYFLSLYYLLCPSTLEEIMNFFNVPKSIREELKKVIDKMA